jgi:ribonuclease VapC
MILDSSAIIAILANEPDREVYIKAIGHARSCRISAGSSIELGIVIEGQYGMDVARQCEALFRRIGVVVEPVTVEQAYLACQAFHDFGKGRHPACLNFGDCFAYALAKAAGEPLLFKGEDFRKTDVAAAI